MKLTKRQAEYARQMLLCIKRKQETVSYDQLAETVLQDTDQTISYESIHKDLTAVSKICVHLQLPPISRIAVYPTTNECGIAFYDMCIGLGLHRRYADLNEMYDALLVEVHQCKEWSRLSDFLSTGQKYPS